MKKNFKKNHPKKFPECLPIRATINLNTPISKEKYLQLCSLKDNYLTNTHTQTHRNRRNSSPRKWKQQKKSRNKSNG